MPKQKRVLKAITARPRRRSNTKNALFQRLGALNREQQSIEKRCSWISQREIPLPQTRHLNLGRGKEMESSPYQWQYSITRVNPRNEEARRLLKEDERYWLNAYQKNLAEMEKIRRKLYPQKRR